MPMGPILQEFATIARERADELALWSRGESLRLTFGELRERVDDWSRAIASFPPHTVALATGNGAAFLELFLALRSRGIPVAILDGELPFSEKIATCRRFGVPTLLHRDAKGSTIGETIQVTRIQAVEAVAPPAGTAVIKVTSGCTGQAVGACFTEEALLVGIRQIAAGMEISSRDRVLIAIPLSHSYGFDSGVLSLAAIGTPLVLEPDYFPRALITTMRDTGTTFFPAVPPLIRSLAECDDWPEGLALRRVICAAGPLSREDALLFHERSGLHVHQFYGCTESGGITFERDPSSPEAVGTVGQPLPGVRISLDEERHVRVDSAANYLARLGADDDSTPRSITPGDTGEWTPEGRLRLTGRSADFLKIAGRKVHAARIEDALRELEGVDDAAVVGVSDPARGERAVAFVVTSDGPPDTQSLPPELTPREIRQVAELPYTPRGKLDRQQLRRIATTRNSG